MQRAMIISILLMFIINIYATNVPVSTSETSSSSTQVESPIATIPASSADSTSVTTSSSYLMGQNDAQIFHQPTGWFVLGFDSTLLLGPVGFLGAPIVATRNNPAFIPPNVDIRQYKTGYKNTALYMNRRATIQGGLLAAAVLVISYAIIYNALDDLDLGDNGEW